MDIDLKDKVVLITGGLSGAGVSIVREFFKTGCKIATTYTKSQPKELLDEYASKGIKVYKYDLANLDEIDILLNNVINDFGKIDVLVNNAGIYPAKKLEDIKEEDYDRMMNINNKGTFFLSKAVSKYINNGSIINISSINAVNPALRLIHYSMSKAAIEMQTRSLAMEYGPRIRVNCIAPGLIYNEEKKWIPSWIESYNSRAALHRLVKPEEIGKVAVFLASDLSSAITGQIITVDCGISLASYFDDSKESE